MLWSLWTSEFRVSLYSKLLILNWLRLRTRWISLSNSWELAGSFSMMLRVPAMPVQYSWVPNLRPLRKCLGASLHRWGKAKAKQNTTHPGQQCNGFLVVWIGEWDHMSSSGAWVIEIYFLSNFLWSLKQIHTLLCILPVHYILLQFLILYLIPWRSLPV